MSRYTYRAEWCPTHDEYIATCTELPFLTRRAPTGHEAIAAIEQAVDEHLQDVRASGEEAPPPLTERNFSGTFVVRTSRELHTRLVLEAAEQRVSMNHWVVQKLADRQLGSGLSAFGFD
ncbi:type II toxin-antitoxin system HicB family antitoxin [Mycobacterium sp.]|uniref:type II toxin-antitoxin system HicB family antitoxin n=1 Tax=Mycobacterium sp. TaxID=1785 RepID=UPI003C77A536